MRGVVYVSDSTKARLWIEVYYSWHSDWTYLHGKLLLISLPLWCGYWSITFGKLHCESKTVKMTIPLYCVLLWKMKCLQDQNKPSTRIQIDVLPAQTSACIYTGVCLTDSYVNNSSKKNCCCNWVQNDCRALMHFITFYARQLYRQVLLRACISYGISVCPSVRPSVCHNPVVYQAQVR